MNIYTGQATKQVKPLPHEHLVAVITGIVGALKSLTVAWLVSRFTENIEV